MDTDGKHPAFLGAFFLPVRRIHFPNMTMRLHGGVAPILFTEALPGRLGGKLPRLCFFGGRIFWAQEIAGYQGDSKWRMIPDRWRSLYLSLIFSKRSLNYHKKVRYNWQAVCFSEYFFEKEFRRQDKESHDPRKTDILYICFPDKSTSLPPNRDEHS